MAPAAHDTRDRSTALAAAVPRTRTLADRSTDMSTTLSLSQLKADQRGTIVEITAEPVLALHILEIGMVKGAKVRFLRAAPLGGPIEVEVDGFLLSLRRDEANAILVDVSHNGSDPY